jgi:hypothetical protein
LTSTITFCRTQLRPSVDLIRSLGGGWEDSTQAHKSEQLAMNPRH